MKPKVPDIRTPGIRKKPLSEPPWYPPDPPDDSRPDRLPDTTIRIPSKIRMPGGIRSPRIPGL